MVDEKQERLEYDEFFPTLSCSNTNMDKPLKNKKV